MKKIKIIMLAFAVATILLSAGCAEQKQKLNIGCFPNITHSQALYAMDHEEFDNAIGEDIQTEWYTFNAGPSQMESVRTGKIDIGYIGPIPAVTGYAASDKNITIIAGASSAGSLLVTRNDIHTSDISELKGLTVAVPQFGNTQDIILRMLLKEKNIPTEGEDAVEIIQQSNANIKALMTTGQIDAALVPEPWGTRLVKEANANVLLDYNDILNGDYPVAVVIVRNDYLQNNRETVKNFLKMHIKLTSELNSNPKAVSQKVNSGIYTLTGVMLDDSVLSESYGRINFDWNISESSIRKFIDICIGQGIVDKNISFDKLIDMSILNEALQELQD